jgi:hypothetical protein
MDKNIPFEKSFASCEKAKFWHKEKNDNMKPEDITIRTSTKYWFICDNPECEHEFLMSPDKIASGNWCIYCRNNKICDDETCKKCFEKSFASHKNAIYWNNEKNGITPNKVNKYSNDKFWFNCQCGHIFNSVLSKVTKGQFCQYCASKKLCDNKNCKKCFNNSFASNEKAQYWNYEKNSNITPRDIFKSSNMKYWFTCIECNHIFDIAINNISQGKWCSYCVNKKLCDNINCNFCFNNSFASHKKAVLWSVKNQITPRMVAKCSGKKYWFKCIDCTHEFETNISYISNNNEKYCPICSSQWLCNDESCKICFEKSFASHPKFSYLDKEKYKDINFRMVFRNSNIKYWFICDCGHNNEISLNSVSSGSWCSYCCNPPLKLCEKEDCEQCFKKSFASHPRIKYIDNSEINTNFRLIFKGSHNKYNFKCDNGHVFLKQIKCITSKQSSWCPKCTRKTEKKMYDTLSKIYPDLIFQYRADWCKNNETKCYLPFDYVLEEYKIIIELDGKQHFKQVNNWCKPEETQKRDKYKMRKANDNGYSIIRILQFDVYHDKYNWLEEIITNINFIVSNSKIQNIYMCKNDEYKIFQHI